jgi:hypothetical protein
MPPKQVHPPPPPTAGDKEEECVGNKEVCTVIKALTELFTKNQQSTDTTLERVERSMAGIIDHANALEIGLPQIDQDKLPDDTREDDHDDAEEVDEKEPSTLHIHHHDGRTAMTSRCTKSFHAIHIDQIGKVWEATLIVALINSMHAVILLLKLSL